MVEPLVGHVQRVTTSVVTPSRPAGPQAQPHLARREEGLDLAGVADDGDLLLVLRALGEHAEVEAGPGAPGEVDDDEGVVEDVGGLAVVALVEVVDVLVAGGQHPHRLVVEDVAHEVEEVATLLDQGAAGVAGEAVPVPDLLQEREPVLPDRPPSGPGPRCRTGPPR